MHELLHTWCLKRGIKRGYSGASTLSGKLRRFTNQTMMGTVMAAYTLVSGCWRGGGRKYTLVNSAWTSTLTTGKQVNTKTLSLWRISGELAKCCFEFCSNPLQHAWMAKRIWPADFCKVIPHIQNPLHVTITPLRHREEHSSSCSRATRCTRADERLYQTH